MVDGVYNKAFAAVNERKIQGYLKFKQFVDFLIAVPVFVLFIPFGILIAVIIFLDDPRGGSPIFFQDRLGKGMKKFKCIKFRTMTKEAPNCTPTSCLENADDYVTGIGKFLRKTSIDELPQLWNVIRGEMSLVGPRPLILCETDVHEKRHIQGVYAIKPGLTGLAQINGRDLVDGDAKADLDYQYYRDMSFKTDVKIIVRTFRKVVKMENVSEGAKEFAPEGVVDSVRE